ncbi:MAG: hypothetical protein V1872_11585 [bacterium]
MTYSTVESTLKSKVELNFPGDECCNCSNNSNIQLIPTKLKLIIYYSKLGFSEVMQVSFVTSC